MVSIDFPMPIKKKFFFTLIAFLCILGLGTVGFLFTEPTVHTPLDAFFLALVTITTVGYGGYSPTTDASRIVAIFCILFGIGTALAFFQITFEIFISSERRRELGIPERRIMMKDHYIVCGYGNVGKHIVAQLKERKEKVVVIERDHEKVEDLMDAGIPVIEGNAEGEDVLQRANIGKAKCIITTMPDFDNVMVIITSRTINPDIRIVTEIEESRDLEKLKAAGADEIVHSHEAGARAMVIKARNVRADIVCGAEICGPPTIQFTFDGTVYYFCSEACENAFKNNPARFIQRQNAVEVSCHTR